MKQEEINKKYVPYGMNGMYFVYDNEAGQIPMNYGTKGADKATIQRICNGLNLQEQQTDKQVNAFTGGKWEANIDHNRDAGNYPKTRVKSNGRLIAECYKKHWSIEVEEAEANAALIASAPALKAENEKLLNDVRALREALEGITRAFKKVSEEHCPDDPICEWLGEAHEALLKTKQD